jgi:histone H4
MELFIKKAIKRLARRAGVKRIARDMYDETREALKSFLRGVIGDAVMIMGDKRKTLGPMDVVYALKRRGRPIYGFGM